MEQILKEIKDTEEQIRKLRDQTDAEVAGILAKGKSDAEKLIEKAREELATKLKEKLAQHEKQVQEMKQKILKSGEQEIRQLNQKANREKGSQKILELFEVHLQGISGAAND